MKNALFITFRKPEVDKKGDQLVSYYRLKYLKCADWNIKEINVSDTYKFTYTNLMNTLKLLVFHGQPVQVAIFNGRLAMSFSELSNYDLIYVNSIRCWNFIPKNLVKNRNFYYELIDSLSLNYTRRAKIEQNFIKRLLLSMEAKRLHKLEVEISRKVSMTSVVSSIDKSHIGVDTLRVAKLGVDYLSEAPKPVSKGRLNIGFLGNLNYEPNFHAVLELIEIVNNARQLGIELKCTIAGKIDPSKINSMCVQSDVCFLGFVENKRQFLSSLDIFVAPLVSGSGMQNKILEAMEVGTPVLTTRIGVSDINAKNDFEIFIRDKEQFVDFLMSAYLKKISIENIGLQGRSFVKNNHSWENLNREYFVD